ncbi:MAG: TetR-like C-terminal domain-containing protein, partial [Leucobacter sp.]
PPAARLASLARGMREWAVAHPSRWALAYGSPVPGYAAPAEQTTTPGTRVMAAFLALLAEGDAAGAPGGFENAGSRTVVSEGLAAELEAGAAEMGLAVDPALAAAAVEAWTGLVGLISAEVFGQLGPDLARYGAELLDRWSATTASRFGLS